MRWVVPLFVTASGLFFSIMGTFSYLHGRALLERGLVTDAALTGTTHRESDSDTGHQVRYRFQVGDREFERVGIFGTGVASDVTADAQAAAIASGHLKVRYLPEDPTVNEPIAHARPQGDRGAIAVAVGLLLLLVGLARLSIARGTRTTPRT